MLLMSGVAIHDALAGTLVRPCCLPGHPDPSRGAAVRHQLADNVLAEGAERAGGEPFFNKMSELGASAALGR